MLFLVFVHRALQMPLQMVLEFRQFTEQLLSHAKDYQAEQELADKVGYRIVSCH